MKKVLNLFVLLLTTVVASFGQTPLSISPIETNEQCPATNITFTVVLPAIKTGTSINVVSIGTPVVVTNATNVVTTTGSSPNTTFTFVGKFNDDNSTQTFQVQFQTDANSNASKNFPFKKIRSLTFPTSSSRVNPNFQSINSPVCLVNTHNISFPNVSFGNGFDVSVGSYGTVIDYEYLIPSGWNLGAITSNGSTWIRGGNSATVTTNLAGGDNQSIQIRALNSACGINLNKGQITSIPISRSKPALIFTGNPIVCSSNNFQAMNQPSWVTNYAWHVTPTSVFGNSNPNSNPTTVTKLANGEGNIQLTISSNTCPATFTYNTQEITGKPTLVAGLPVISSNQALAIYNAPGDENELCLNVENTINFTTTALSTTNWTYVSHTGSPQPSWSQVGAADLYVYFFRLRQTSLVLKMTTTNDCGSTVYDFGFKPVDCSARTAAATKEFKISPNPVSDLLKVSPVAVSENTRKISEVVVSDFNSQVIMRKAFDNVTTAQLNIGNLRQGTYFITVISGSRQETHTITKQ